MKWILWKVTAEDFVEVARFVDENLAHSCGALAGMLGERYEVTKEGETPIW